MKTSLFRRYIPARLPLKIGILLFAGFAVTGARCDPDNVIKYTFRVNTVADFSDGDPGDGICAGSSANECSLRAAFEETDAYRGRSEIEIHVGQGTYNLTEGDLELTHGGVFIFGAGAAQTRIVQTNDLDRVLTINLSGNPNRDEILIEGVGISGGIPGRGSAGVFDASGGGIRISGRDQRVRDVVNLRNCDISGNVAGFMGGGIFAKYVNLYITNCVLRNNESTGGICTGTGGGLSGGGAIHAEDMWLRIEGSEIHDNCGSNGGGIRHLRGRFTMLQTTVVDNVAATRAGGVYLGLSEFDIRESTVYRNNGISGGGLYLSQSSGDIKNTTIVDNETRMSEFGSGIHVHEPAGPASLTNTAVVHERGNDCVGALQSSGGNFTGPLGPSCTITPGSLTTDFLNRSERLADLFEPFGSVGGAPLSVRVLMPRTGSPLIDRGVPGCGPRDQIGRPAPAGAACDIGAVERP